MDPSKKMAMLFFVFFTVLLWVLRGTTQRYNRIWLRPPKSAVRVRTVAGLGLGRTWDFPTINFTWPTDTGIYRLGCGVYQIQSVWGPALLFMDRFGCGEMHVLQTKVPELLVGSEIYI